MMKRTFTTYLKTLLSCTAMSVTLPDGFVYRARCESVEKSKVLSKIDVTLRFYAQENDATPCWTGFFKDVALITNGLFQIWVSEKAHDTSVAGEDTLEQVLWQGRANWIGVSFGACRESKPRRRMLTAPLANMAVASETLDGVATVQDLVDCDELTAETAWMGSLICGTFSFGDVKDLKFNIRSMSVRSVQLNRDADNAVFGRSRGAWTDPVRLEPGFAITNTYYKAAFLTIQSTDSMVAPLLSVPVPARKVFVWQAAPATCRWRLTPFGVE